jgi:pyruvate formate lyase activating enzyme
MADARHLRLGGLVPLSATDYPGELAAVVFCQGCPWRCGYCHNPHLLPRRAEPSAAWTSVTRFLRRRRGLLDAVVFSGGEPTLQPALRPALLEVRRMGFRTGLHTAGIDPRRLREVLPLVDWVGMDIKAPFRNYERITGAARSGEHARAAATALIQSGVPHEFRTTVDRTLLADEDILRIADALCELGAHCYVLQEARPSGGARAVEPAPSAGWISALEAELAPRFERFSIRRT